METNKIKSFAKQARLILLDGVLQRLKYWGFSLDGSNDQDLQSTQGGYIFRGKVYTDTAVPAKWKALNSRLKDKQAVQDVIEQASYTWFNRLMAIKIMEVNGYLESTLSFTDGIRTPLIVQNAKKGIHSLRSHADKNLLLEYLQEDKEEQAFGLLIAELCNRNNLLHDIFGRIDDYTEILIPQNLLKKDGVLDLINSDAISSDDYKEVELIGWLYQFYISDKKDEVFAGFKKNKKARSEDIPAATQIFTPKWIVKYMVENTVGKIYLDYEPTSSLKEDMKYLVQTSTELSSGNDSDKDNKAIISDITELTLIDPASGSGHILVTGFELLFKMYREAGYTAKQAVDNILEHNLFGLDIDDRAMQLARFAVLLKAAQFDADVLNRGIIPHVYSFPEASHFTSEELQNFLGHDGHQFTAELKEALQLLNQGKNIGSALKLELSEAAQNHIKKQYEDWLLKSKRAGLDIEQSSIWNRLHPFLDVLLVLSKKYASVVANPPYMGQKNMNADLKQFAKDYYPSSKADLFAIFMDVSVRLLKNNGLYGMINQHSWMFLSSYSVLREELLSSFTLLNMLHLGPGTFEEISGEVVQSTAFTVKKKLPEEKFKGVFFRLLKTKPDNREKSFLENKYRHNSIYQIDFSLIDGTPVTYWISKKVQQIFTKCKLVKDKYSPKQGMSTGKNNEFLRFIHELDKSKIGYPNDNNKKWTLYYKGGGYRKWFGNSDIVIEWNENGKRVKDFKGSVIRNSDFYYKKSLSWTLMGSKAFGIRLNEPAIFDAGSSSLFVDDSYYEVVAGLLNSIVVFELLQAINPTSNFSNGVIGAVPVMLPEQDDLIKDIKSLVNDNYLISTNDYFSKEGEWLFLKHPLLKFNDKSALKESYNNWLEKVSNDFFQLHSNEEELNRIFIDIYGLQEELTPEVALKDITILQEELDRNALEALEPVFREQGKEAISLPINKAEVISQFLSYGIGVFLGRYRLDKPGLNIAHPNPKEEETAKYQYNGHNIEIDEDGILPLMGEDCAFPNDALVRTKDLVHAIWGEGSLTENINFIHDALGMDLHKWLTEKFWGYHTSMYKKKPIYWLFSSNVQKPQNAAFKVLVYMHRMDKYTVQKIQRNYLHPHQEYIKREIEKLSDNEENLGKQEIKRLEQLRNWELECRDYNEVLKELANQQIEFDLDDGVDANYAKFEGAVAKI